MAIPKHYKLVKEHSNSYEMHDSRDKSNFHIAKKDLNLAMHAKLSKVQKLSDGGAIYGAPDVDDKIAKEKQHAKEVTSQGGSSGPGDVRTADQKAKAAEYERTGMLPSSGSSSSNIAGTDSDYYRGGKVRNYEAGGYIDGINPVGAPDDATQDTSNGAVDWFKRAVTPGGNLPTTFVSKAPGANPEIPQDVPPQAVDTSLIAAPAAAPAPTGGEGSSAPPAPYDILAEMKKSSGLANQSVNEQYDAATQKSNLDQKLYQDQQNDLLKMRSDHDDRMAQMNQRSNDLYDSISKSKIDPEAYWNNHSRITAGLGVLLSGIGAGLQGSTKNLALETIQGNIEKEIDSQKANLSTKNNLYKMNLDQTNNEREAYLMTKSDLLTMTAAKANEIAAKVGTPQAKAARDMLLSQLGTQQAQLHQQVAITGIAHKAYTDGIPQEAVPYLPQEQQKRMVQLPDGRMADAGSDSSAAAVKEKLAPIMDVKSSLDRLDQISSSYARLPIGPERAKAQAEINNITDGLKSMAGQNRFSDPAVDYQMEKFSDPTSMKEIFNGNASTQQLRKILDGKMDSVYRANVPAYQAKKAKVDAIPFKKN